MSIYMMKTVEMILKFLEDYENIVGIPQVGEDTFYPRMKRKHNKLEVDKSIREQFNILRVVDNENYPAWFSFDENEYIIKVYKNDKKA